MAKRKPTALEVTSSYEKRTIEVPYYIDPKDDNEIWFIDSKGQVLNRYLPLYDTGIGVPVPLARKTSGALLRRVVLGALQYLFLPQSKVSLAFAQAFLDLADTSKRKLRKVRDILKFSGNTLHDNIKKLVREFGPAEAISLALDFDSDGVKFATREDILQELEDMVELGKTVEEAKAKLLEVAAEP